MDRKRPQKGDVYIHFKGKQYQIICIAMHTETEEELVVYQALYGNRGIYARPVSYTHLDVYKRQVRITINLFL